MIRLIAIVALLLLFSFAAGAQETLSPSTPPAGTIPATPDQPVSSTRSAFDSAVSSPAVIVGDGHIRWLKGTPAPGQTVYVRLRGPALKAVLSGQAWRLTVEDRRRSKPVEAKAEVVANLHTVSAALGPMKPGPTGESLWPLMLELDMLPIKKLKLSLQLQADQTLPGFRLARLDQTGNLAEVVAEFAAASTGPVWLEPEPQVRPELWGILVADGEKPVQLRNVTAFAAEVCLSFVMPEKGELVLSSSQGDGAAGLSPSLEVSGETVELSGELDGLAVSSSPPAKSEGLGGLLDFGKPKQGTDKPVAESAPAATNSTGTLLLGIACGAVGMALLIGGISLLRRKMQVD